MRMCDLCRLSKPLKGAVYQDKFGHFCNECRDKFARSDNAGSASYKRDRQREEHERDLIQPWINGKPNTAYIREYPEIAKETFSKEELENYG